MSYEAQGRYVDGIAYFNEISYDLDMNDQNYK